MPELLPPPALLAAFLIASLVLAVTPGPGVLYIVARSAAQGTRIGLASVAGVALGNLALAIGAAGGLAVLFTISSAAFVVVKYAGAAYLIYLGISALRAASDRPQTDSPSADSVSACVPGSDLGRVFRDGLVVALLNPKTAIFFAAFLPQFFSPGADPVLQGLVLGALFVAIAAATDALYAIMAGSIGGKLRGNPRIRRGGRIVTGSTFIGLGVFAALADIRRPA